MNSWYHAKSCARKWGGKPEDYLDIHTFIDSSKQVIGDARHRALFHHTYGIFVCQQVFGPVRSVPLDSGRTVEVPVRLIAERHVEEDLGWIPSPYDYWREMPLKLWMSGSQRRTFSFSSLREEVSDE